MHECCVEGRQRNDGWKWLPCSGVRVPMGRVVGAELRRGGRYLLVGRSHAGTSVIACDLEDDRCLVGFVDGSDHGFADVVTFSVDLEDLNLGDPFVTGEIDGGLGELVGPGNALNLVNELLTQCGRDCAVFVELGLRYLAAEFGGVRPAVEDVGLAVPLPGSTTAMKAISSKSSRPAIVCVSAVVAPPVKRLSMSRSSVTWTIEWIAAVSSSE